MKADRRATIALRAFNDAIDRLYEAADELGDILNAFELEPDEDQDEEDES